jgi:RNA polymerase sigma factor FliA
MATQSVPTFQQLGLLAAPPPLRRPTTAGRCRPLRPSPALPKACSLEEQAQDRESLLVEMLPQVRRAALKIRKHLPAHVELDELIANGLLGLVDAMAKFDPRKRVKLEAYARHRIRGGILDGLRGADPASRGLRRKTRAIQKLYRELEAKLSRCVRDEEMARELGMNLAQWYRTLDEIQGVGFDCHGRRVTAGPTPKSLSPETDGALLGDSDPDPFALCYRREQRELLARALTRLPERERRIITLYYSREMTMKQISKRMHVDQSRISQLHSEAIVRLRRSVDSLLHSPRAVSSESGSLSMAAGTGP